MLTFHQVMIAGGLDPLLLHVILCFLPALISIFSPTKPTSNGLKYMSTATRTTNGGCTLLLLTSQLYTASKWDRFSFAIFKTPIDFLRSGKCWVSSDTNSPSRHQVILGNGLPPVDIQVRVILAPSAYGEVMPFFVGPVSSLTCTDSGGTGKGCKILVRFSFFHIICDTEYNKCT